MWSLIHRLSKACLKAVGGAVNRGFQNKRGQAFKKYLFTYLAMLGLSCKIQHIRYLLCHVGSFQCGPRTLSLWHAGSVVVAHRHVAPQHEGS